MIVREKEGRQKNAARRAGKTEQSLPNMHVLVAEDNCDGSISGIIRTLTEPIWICRSMSAMPSVSAA